MSHTRRPGAPAWAGQGDETLSWARRMPDAARPFHSSRGTRAKAQGAPTPSAPSVRSESQPSARALPAFAGRAEPVCEAKVLGGRRSELSQNSEDAPADLALTASASARGAP